MNARRRTRIVALSALVAVVLFQGPAFADTVNALWQHQIIDVARGHTATAVAIKVGRDIAFDGPDVPSALTVTGAGDRCGVVETGTPVPCNTRLSVTPVPGGFLVTARVRGETFTYDSTAVKTS